MKLCSIHVGQMMRAHRIVSIDLPVGLIIGRKNVRNHLRETNGFILGRNTRFSVCSFNDRRVVRGSQPFVKILDRVLSRRRNLLPTRVVTFSPPRGRLKTIQSGRDGMNRFRLGWIVFYYWVGSRFVGARNRNWHLFKEMERRETGANDTSVDDSCTLIWLLFLDWKKRSDGRQEGGRKRS